MAEAATRAAVCDALPRAVCLRLEWCAWLETPAAAPACVSRGAAVPSGSFAFAVDATEAEARDGRLLPTLPDACALGLFDDEASNSEAMSCARCTYVSGSWLGPPLPLAGDADARLRRRAVNGLQCWTPNATRRDECVAALGSAGSAAVGRLGISRDAWRETSPQCLEHAFRGGVPAAAAGALAVTAVQAVAALAALSAARAAGTASGAGAAAVLAASLGGLGAVAAARWLPKRFEGARRRAAAATGIFQRAALLGEAALLYLAAGASVTAATGAVSSFVEARAAFASVSLPDAEEVPGGAVPASALAYTLATVAAGAAAHVVLQLSWYLLAALHGGADALARHGVHRPRLLARSLAAALVWGAAAAAALATWAWRGAGVALSASTTAHGVTEVATSVTTSTAGVGTMLALLALLVPAPPADGGGGDDDGNDDDGDGDSSYAEALQALFPFGVAGSVAQTALALTEQDDLERDLAVSPNGDGTWTTVLGCTVALLFLAMEHSLAEPRRPAAATGIGEPLLAAAADTYGGTAGGGAGSGAKAAVELDAADVLDAVNADLADAEVEADALEHDDGGWHLRLARTARLLARFNTWHNVHRVAVLNSCFTIAVSGYLLHEGSAHREGLLGLVALAAVAGACSVLALVQRRWPRVKVLPSDDNFRLLVLLKAGKVMVKASVLAHQSSRTVQGLFVTLFVLSALVLLVIVFTNAMPLMRRPEGISDSGVSRPHVLLAAYMVGFVTSKALLVVVGAVSVGATFGLGDDSLFALRLFFSVALFVTMYANNETARFLDGCKVTLARGTGVAAGDGRAALGISRGPKGMFAFERIAWIVVVLLALPVYSGGGGGGPGDALLALPALWGVRAVLMLVARQGVREPRSGPALAETLP